MFDYCELDGALWADVLTQAKTTVSKAASASFGHLSPDVPSFKRDIPPVVARISRDLFLDDLASHEARINAPIADDFDPALYAPAVWRAQSVVAAE